MTDQKQLSLAVSSCIVSLGTRRFYECFFQLLQNFIGIDQCVVFQLDSNDELSCLLSRNFHDNKVVRTAAKSYVEGGFKSDPNLKLFHSIEPAEVKVVYFEDLVARMDPAYRDHYFDDLGLSDKVSIITADHGHRYYINLYRGKSWGSFQNDRVFESDGLESLISSIVARHFALNNDLREEGSLAFLTDRERDVCRRILQGKKAETIAGELGVSTNTVVTYKKRAYAKLGINSRRALFALCKK